MAKFTRNYRREGMWHKGHPGQWYSLTFQSVLAAHVFTEDGENWQTRITGAASFEGDGFKSQQEAESFALRRVRKIATAIIKDVDEIESEASND